MQGAPGCGALAPSRVTAEMGGGTDIHACIQWQSGEADSDGGTAVARKSTQTIAGLPRRQIMTGEWLCRRGVAPRVCVVQVCWRLKRLKIIGNDAMGQEGISRRLDESDKHRGKHCASLLLVVQD